MTDVTRGRRSFTIEETLGRDREVSGVRVLGSVAEWEIELVGNEFDAVGKDALTNSDLVGTLVSGHDCRQGGVTDGPLWTATGRDAPVV